LRFLPPTQLAAARGRRGRRPARPCARRRRCAAMRI